MEPRHTPKPRPLHELLGREAPATPAAPIPKTAPAPAPARRATGRRASRPVPTADVPPAAAPRTPAAPEASAPPPAPDSATASTAPTPSRAARARPRARSADTGTRIAIIDGSNVAHAGEGSGARLANVLAMREKLAAEGFEPVIVVDAALRHQIDDAGRYERLVADGLVKQAPAGTDADYFILAFAKELGATVVSNDQFRDGGSQFAEVRKRVIRYMIVADEVVLERRAGRRTREEGRGKR